jgi:hypothetical protein
VLARSGEDTVRGAGEFPTKWDGLVTATELLGGSTSLAMTGAGAGELVATDESAFSCEADAFAAAAATTSGMRAGLLKSELTILAQLG